MKDGKGRKDWKGLRKGRIKGRKGREGKELRN